jgi:hypothetical protein
MLWTHASTVVSPFSDHGSFNLPVPCTYDFNVATAKYFYALEGGEVRLNLLFSGTIFYEDEDIGLQVSRIPWEKEANFQLPVQVWKDMMEMYYPNCAWLCLRRDVFNRLYRCKSQRCVPTWEKVLEDLLSAANERVMS